MERNDRVKIKRGVWKGHEARITEVTSGGTRVGVQLIGSTRLLGVKRFNLAASSVEPVSK
jgi:transcription antitermination factor NusG